MPHDRCDVFCYDEHKVNRLKAELTHINESTVVNIFKALADETRIKIAYALCIETELCVCDVANTIGCTTATASHHLRLLRNIGLATSRKEGKLVFYSLGNQHVKQLILQAFTTQEEGVNPIGTNG
ncbi:ArsR/SmtB family transcription factor [Tuberibacillus sp. Marseille-P3662]|uniref:ArsR/SmtB family transcription factor n=1 Tax=Tuberibacillus sp. Marseille-P3662 TaxID=1965358 RepID=UPI000A1CAE10|nr:metalloregulator ArsR/SmtB family transcription factor [Tuberibacillus sp. Marseille-P3662]